MPKVSVIIPTYNRCGIISNAIDSVLAQTFKDYELIVVDDGSEDDTRSVVMKYGSDKILYWYQENSGKSSARNNGIKKATGEYIAFLDSDDMFVPDKLRKQVDFLDNNRDYGFVYSYANNVDEDGTLLDYHFAGDLSGWIYPNMLFIKNNLIATPTVMVKSSVIASVGGFDETMHICEDLDLWRRIARNHKVMQIKEPLSIVRIRTSERIDVIGFMAARTNYYLKAFRDDPELERIAPALFAEMYGTYFDCAAHYGDRMTMFRVLAEYMRRNPVGAVSLFMNKVMKWAMVR
jgi:cellulose synthase/poly-beta-1,6-N-acetylglucosamine synthase-like glycosyltransferase